MNPDEKVNTTQSELINFRADEHILRNANTRIRDRLSDIRHNNDGDVVDNSLENKLKEANSGISRLNSQLRICQQSSKQERDELNKRIEELEIDLETMNYERQEEKARHKQYLIDTEQRTQSLSQELTKMLLKNATLLEENAVLKSCQITLSSRVSLLEEKLSLLEQPKRESIQNFIETLEAKETEIKNQCQRLAQLESYYTKELEHLSASRSELQEDKFPISYSSQLYQSPLKMSENHKSPSPSYSELYYKRITDKAISIIQKEADNCENVLCQLGRKEIKPTTPVQQQLHRQAQSNHHRKTIEQNERKLITTPKSSKTSIMSEEEETLRQLFFKF